jgi:hypothetical protein
MKQSPQPRPKVYDLYWIFASERQKAFEKRRVGLPGPWTEDPILQEYKFCNVFRAADRVSQYLIRDVAYKADHSTPADKIFQILAFRMFSKNETWESLTKILGHAPLIEDLISGSFEKALSQVKKDNGKLYTGAFILCANDAYGFSEKHLNHVALFRKMFVVDQLHESLLLAKSLKEIYNLLHDYPLMGDFMSYQIAIDLNYFTYIQFSENDFVQPGPGALRGLKKAFTSLGDFTPAETILWMVENQQREFERLGLEFKGLNGRPLHAIDCQGLFCELDKYCRVAVPELVSARNRIKSRFNPNAQPIEYFFPPKWGINKEYLLSTSQPV